MERSKGEDLSSEQAASLFGTNEPESQSRHTARGRKKRATYWKVIIGVLLLCLLIIILAVVISTKQRGDGNTGSWLELSLEDTEQAQCPPGFSRSPLILVSLDGFRAEYLKTYNNLLPVINKLRTSGTTTPHMRPVYPTKTFPNHYTIVTGLYPESHGIVDNKMYDVTRNVFFSLKTDEKFKPAWYQGQPVWITAMRQNLKTGTYFWPGSDVAINGSYPNFFQFFDRKIPFEKRVSTLLEWLSLPQEKRPDFYTLYLDEPDTAGHHYGPHSDEVIQALQKVDRILGMLMDGLKQRNLHNCVNLIVTSDHGMEEATCEKAMYISSFQENIDDFTLISGPAARVRPKRLPEDFFSFNYEGLVRNLSCQIPNQPMRPYLKEHLPKRLHFARNVRIERGHIYMKSGWQAARQKSEIKYCKGGFHGSDNFFKNMQAIFIGYGRDFKRNTTVPPFENIELYNLMCDLLGIQPAPNNGTHGSLNHLLKHPNHIPVHPAQLSHQTPCETIQPIPTDDLGCTCRTKQWETTMNMQLLNNSSDKVFLRHRHHLYGTPTVIQPDVSFCLLYHTDFLSGYSKGRLMPLWVSYTIPPLTTVRPLTPEYEECIRADVRVPKINSQLCLRYRNNTDVSYGLLHPPSLGSEEHEADSLLISNVAPMFPAFQAVWIHFHEVLLPEYSQKLNGVNVMSGPIFDEDYDGHVDAHKLISHNEAPIPTHFFVILTSCGDSTLSPVECKGPLQAVSFILPHRPDYIETCANGTDYSWVEDFVQFHSARVRDIELLTGLSFYHDRLSVQETLQLKTFVQTHQESH